AKIMEYCNQKDIISFSTPSHINDVDRLYEMGVPAFKFGSVQVTDLPTIIHAANYGRPVMISGGASDMSEVLRAVEAIIDTGNDQLALLHCTSIYPCRDYSFLNLNILRSFQSIFDFPVGYSDHTLGPTIVPVAAVAMGAKIIEKHITLDRKMEGPDHAFALEPTELSIMVEAIRKTEQALGNRYLRILREEKEIARMGRRSLVTTRTIKAGEVISVSDITIKRPGYGIEPFHLKLVIGRSARQDIEANRVLTWDMI
ncbi:MAG: N-acetylneuraminate synthase family protein, partial [SAR324 cluster bacterium]|nr:N-acetylneuraminate synthase family protein [SAR324 cluster bacterium]